MDSSVHRAEAHDEHGEPEEVQAHAADVEVGDDADDGFAARRLRRWLEGMFGGGSSSRDESSSER